MATESQEHVWTVNADPTTQDIDDVELHEYGAGAIAKFAVSFAIGAFFFLLPVPRIRAR